MLNVSTLHQKKERFRLRAVRQLLGIFGPIPYWQSKTFVEGAQWLSGRVLDSRPKGRGFEPHRRHCVVSLSKNINPSLVLVQPRKTRPFITEILLMGLKESNQTKTIVDIYTLCKIRQRPSKDERRFWATCCMAEFKHMYI